ncbi:MAG: hypothetical protein CSA15_06075 [Candidatus Delongbacteria bacterium]|nr:MAG: hypothetical protein CSA15_06075 [Candidatus Delongbacteria bacterium]
MEKRNKVTVFASNFLNQDEFNNYLQENFTEDGDMYSELTKELGVDYIDNQFQEVYFSGENISLEDLKRFSYSENFINKIDMNFSMFNSLILLYDYAYTNKERLERLHIIGVFDYR